MQILPKEISYLKKIHVLPCPNSKHAAYPSFLKNKKNKPQKGWDNFIEKIKSLQGV
jgi:hypothetical protein